MKMIERLYVDEPVGGALHILTDDWNTELRHVWFCVKAAVGVDRHPYLGADGKRWPRRSWRGVRILLWMLTMREKTRVAVLAAWSDCEHHYLARRYRMMYL